MPVLYKEYGIYLFFFDRNDVLYYATYYIRKLLIIAHFNCMIEEHLMNCYPQKMPLKPIQFGEYTFQLKIRGNTPFLSFFFSFLIAKEKIYFGLKIAYNGLINCYLLYMKVDLVIINIQT